MNTGMLPGHMEPQKGEEEMLLQHLGRLRSDAVGAFAVHVHLSDLRPGNRQPRFLGIAKRSFDEFISGHDSILFTMYNADLVLMCRNVPIEDVDPVIEKVKALFSEDPLVQGETGSYEDRFTTWHDLSQPDDFRALSAKIKEQEAAATIKFEKDLDEYKVQLSATDQGTPLAPANLAAIDQTMRSTQIADIIRNQPVYHVIPGKKGAIVFREHFIAMGELKKRVAPNVNLFGSPWLFQYLTETLDRRMLAVMSRRDLGKTTDSISLNLNINTIMSRDFQQFHESLGEHTSQVVIEIQIIDIFSDLSAYHHAHDFLRERGYKVLVDGLSPIAINFFDPSILQADFLKISWGPEFVGEEKEDKIADMRRIVSRAGKHGVILSRVDSEDAVKWGATLGIARFQGYFIDKLVAAVSAKSGAV